MKYLLLVFEDEGTTPNQGDTGWQELWDAYVELDAEARAAGVLVDSQPLQARRLALQVTSNGGRPAIEHGPVAVAPRQLTGYYLVEVEGEQQAVAWAARIPTAASGGIVEVRALFEP